MQENLQEFSRSLAVSHRCQVQPEVVLALLPSLLLPPNGVEQRTARGRGMGARKTAQIASII